MKEKLGQSEFVLVFRTNISKKKQVKLVSPLLNAVSEIIKWNIDLSDVDNVLRIEATRADCAPVIALVTQAGYVCEELLD